MEDYELLIFFKENAYLENYALKFLIDLKNNKKVKYRLPMSQTCRRK